MADPEHIALARSGANAIARWRELTFRSPNTQVPHYSLQYRLEDRAASENFEPDYIYGRPSLDLSGAMLSGVKLPAADLMHDNLSGADLTAANLHRANLSGANLHDAHLSRSNLANSSLLEAQMSGCSLARANLGGSVLRQADLRGADLSYAALAYANLQDANLSGADLTQADLSWANLTGASLRGATVTAAKLQMADLSDCDLRGVRFTNADLESAIFFRSTLGLTLFANCDLSLAIGLDFAVHAAPSVIALDTLSRSGGRIPREFLAGAGVAPPLIAAQDALRESRRAFPTALLIGSLADGELAGRVQESLAAAGIRSWRLCADDESSAPGGAASLGEAMYYDRLLLLGTAAALDNPLSSRRLAELARAGRQAASPARLVTLAASPVVYQRDDRLCAALREGKLLDFRQWEEAAEFQTAMEALIAELTAPGF